MAALPFFGTWMKTDLFQSCGYCWVFQFCWNIECSTLTISFLRIWNNSTGIPHHLDVAHVYIFFQTSSELIGSKYWIVIKTVFGNTLSVFTFFFVSSLFPCTYLFQLFPAFFLLTFIAYGYEGHLLKSTATACLQQQHSKLGKKSSIKVICFEVSF